MHTQILRRDRGHHAATIIICQSALVALLSGVIVLLSGAAAAIATAQFGLPPDIEALRALFGAQWQHYLVPEPVERAAYLAAVAVTFPAVFLWALWATRYLRGWGSRHFASAVSLSAALLVVGGFAEGSFVRYILTGDPRGTVGILIIVQVVVAIALASFAITQWGAAKTYWGRSDCSRYVNIFLGVVVIGLAAARVRSPDMLYGDIHFEAVFYSITQVVAGRTLLADLPAQYGLYAELLGPVLKLTGLSVVGFTILFAFLHAVSLLALVWLLAITIRSPFLRLLAGMTILLFVGSIWLHIWHGPIAYEYFQLWPIRFLFPTLVVLAFVLVHRRGMKFHHVGALALLAGIGVIWNFDWGIPAYGALVAYFLVRLLSGTREFRRRDVYRLAIIAVVPVFVCLVFLTCLAAKSGWRISLVDWMKYQTIFYSTGFGMLPLPARPHPWMIVVSVYLFGLVHSITMRVRGRGDLVSDVVMLLSVLGLGIFTYYQGRSHDVVLSFVLWPAVLIGFIIADKVKRAVALSLLPPLTVWVCFPVLVMGLLSSFAMIVGTPRLLDDAATVFARLVHAVPSNTHINVEFISDRTKGTGSAVILASGQSILFAETGLASAVPGPGIIEMLLLEDQEKLLVTILESQLPHVFIEATSEGGLPETYRRLLERYNVLDTSSAGLLYLQPSSPLP